MHTHFANRFVHFLGCILQIHDLAQFVAQVAKFRGSTAVIARLLWHLFARRLLDGGAKANEESELVRRELLWW